MIDATILDKLKRVNVSSDKGKTKQRVAHLWKSAAREIKRDIIQRTELKDRTVYRIFREGTISPKIAILLAEELGADPFYLTGDTDVKGEYSDSVAEQFLRDKGYSELFDGAKVKKQTRRKRTVAKAESMVAPAPVPVIEISETPVTEDEPPICDISDAADLPTKTVTRDIADTMTEDELILLIRALYVRAKYDDHIKMNLTTIMQILIDC